ncbi:hypothetical protein JCM6882_008784 [Rhodosporidiobolus microsporus]
MQPAPLADPSAMSPQQRTDELVKAVEMDDLLGVLLVLKYAGRQEVNSRSSRTGRTPLSTTIATPLRRMDVRRLIAECLLLDGADPEEGLRQRPAASTAALVDIVGNWRRGGREKSVAAYRLRFQQTLEQAEAYIRTNSLGVDSLSKPAQEPTASVTDERRSNDPSRRPPHHVERSQPVGASFSSHHHHDPPRPPRRSLSPRRRRSPSPRSRVTPSSSSRPTRPASPPRPANSQRRGFSPDRKVTSGTAALFWVFVGNMPSTVAERYIFDLLEARGIRVGEIFLSQAASGSRFAFVGVASLDESRAAISSFDGVFIDGVRLTAKPFRDARTGANQPEVGSGKSGPYVGTKKQAARSDDTRCGVTLMHLSPRTRPTDVAQFLAPVVPPNMIERIDVRTLGISTLAFCRLYDREVARKAILEFDGKILLGHATRLNWMEPDKRPVPEQHSNQPRSYRWLPGDDKSRPPSTRSPSPLSKRRRLSQDQSKPSPKVPSQATSTAPDVTKTSQPVSTNPFPPAAKSSDTAVAAYQKPPQNQQVPQDDPQKPSEPSSVPHKAPVPDVISASELATAVQTVESASPSDPVNSLATSAETTSPEQATEGARLGSFGLSVEETKAIQQAWQPVNANGDASTRTVDLKAHFGILSQAEAKAALEANKQRPSFPRDEQRQRKFESFLRAQAGESQEYYMTFLAQVADFNRSNALFVDTARVSLQSDGVNGVKGESG